MKRLFLCALVAAVGLLAQPAHAQVEQQTLVDRATLTVQELFSAPTSTDERKLLRDAKGVLVCPQLFKAGFIFGGQGGSCVLLGRSGTGWTSPAFYGFGGGSVGLQIGVQDSQVVFIVLTDKGFRALLDSQFKFGGDASLAFAAFGVGVGGATTAALRADIVAFAQSRGLFAGLSLDGTAISGKSEWNQLYYGRPLAAQQLVLGTEGGNPGADPLREMLTRFAAGG